MKRIYLALVRPVEKAAGGATKYKRKVPDGKGGWRYVYERPNSAGTKLNAFDHPAYATIGEHLDDDEKLAKHFSRHLKGWGEEEHASHSQSLKRLAAAHHAHSKIAESKGDKAGAKLHKDTGNYFTGLSEAHQRVSEWHSE